MSEKDRSEDAEQRDIATTFPNRGLTLDICRNILVFLNARDLSLSALTSKAFCIAVTDAFLWRRLLLRDFTCTIELEQDANSQELGILDPRASYATALVARRQRVIDARTRNIQWKRAKGQEMKQHRMGTLLDTLHIRILSPLLCLAPIVTLLLLGRWMDGKGGYSSYWIAMIPMWVLFGVISLASLSGIMMWAKRDNGVSLYRDIFRGMRGVIWFFIHRVFEERMLGVISGVVALILSLLSLIFIGLKVQHCLNASWFWVFTPLWGVFLLLCLSPCLRWSTRQEPWCYALGVMFCWIPFLATALMAASYLDFGSPKLIIVLSPLWGIEAFFILLALSVCMCVCMKQVARQGGVLRILSVFGNRAEPVAEANSMNPGLSLSVVTIALVGTLCLFLPLVLFESLLIMYVQREEDSEDEDSLSATVLFIPLFLFCSLFLPALIGAAVSYRTRHRPTALQWVDNPLHFPAPLAREGRWNHAQYNDSVLQTMSAAARLERPMSDDGDSDIDIFNRF